MEKIRLARKGLALLLSAFLLLSFTVPQVHAVTVNATATAYAAGTADNGIQDGQVQVTVSCTHNNWDTDKKYYLAVTVANTNSGRSVDKYKVTITFPDAITLGSNSWERPANATLSDDSKTLTLDYTTSVNKIAPGTAASPASVSLTNYCPITLKSDMQDSSLNGNVTLEVTKSTKVAQAHEYASLNEIRNPYFADDYTAGDKDEEVTTYISWATVQFGNYRYDETANAAPITWRVLNVTSDNKVLLISDKVLDSRAYGSGNTTWETSTVREWLNGEFYKEAFSDEEKKALVQNTVDNSQGGVSSSGGSNTSDYVWIPSVSDMQSVSYGFLNAATRRAGVTEYCRTTYSSVKTSGNSDAYYAGYFLRTPGYYQYDVAGVSSYGKLVANGWRTYTKTAGIRPMILVDNTIAKVALYGQVNASASGRYSVTTNSVTKLAKVGTTKTVGKVTYKVTKSSKKTRTVAVTSVGKKARKVTIPSTVTISGNSYKVTAIRANAFKKASKLKTIQLQSKNIKTINKKAFNGLDEDTTVKIVKGKYKLYKKWIQNSTVQIKKAGK